MRRVHVDIVSAGTVQLPATEAHHLRDVLRLAAGDSVELFDASGRSAIARLTRVDRDGVEAQVEAIRIGGAGGRAITVASAVPKADRADWLVEKLSEIGVERWVPLRTARSVVHPEGRSKIERWERIAVEAAKQSRRSGVMRIDPLTPVETFLQSVDPTGAAILSTRPGVRPLTALASQTLLIGPEGGWTEDELGRFAVLGVTEASLTTTVLRLETAAILAAGVAMLA
jgi:16S rRNA (uracil1498-N3)-methyltransferase